MAREVFVFRNGQLIPKDQAEPLRSGPYIISDHLDPMVSMADGKVYDSKSRYYASVKANGCEIVGNEKVSTKPVEMPSVGRDISRAYDELSSR